MEKKGKPEGRKYEVRVKVVPFPCDRLLAAKETVVELHFANCLHTERLKLHCHVQEIAHRLTVVISHSTHGTQVRRRFNQ